MVPPSQNSAELLRRLLDAEVDLVVVGGIAAIAYGSQQLTKDLDIAAPLTEDNVGRLMKVVRPLEPRFYQTLGQPLLTRSDAELATFKNLYLRTTLGIVDVLGQVPPVGDFSAVAARATTIELFGRACRVIALDDLIAVKAFVARPKDLVVEAELRAIRERLGSRQPR